MCEGLGPDLILALHLFDDELAIVFENKQHKWHLKSQAVKLTNGSTESAFERVIFGGIVCDTAQQGTVNARLTAGP